MPPTMREGSLFSTTYPTLVVCCFVYDGHSQQCEVVSHILLIFILLINLHISDSDTEHLFICLWTLRMPSLEKCLFKSFAHYLIGLLVFLEWSHVSSLYILDSNSLSDLLLADIFSHSVVCLFVLLTISFVMQKLLI